MVDRTLGFPTEGEAGWKPVLVGGVVALLTPLLAGLPGVLLAGYLVRVIRAAADEGDPPAWDDLRGLARDGVRFLLATAAYLAVFATVGFAVGAAVLVAVDLGTPGPAAGPFTDTVAAALLTAGVVIGLPTLPVAQVRFVLTDSVAGALNVQRILRTTFTSTYAGTWLLVALLWTITWPFGLLLWVLAVGPFLTFYALVDSYHLFGQSVAAAMPADRSDRARPVPEERPTKAERSFIQDR